MSISSRIITRTTGSPKPIFSFGKEDRLKSRQSISALFEKGNRIDFSPLRILYSVSEITEAPAKMAVSVPKRLHRKAVSRNLLKRRIRESYRMQLPELKRFLRERNISCMLVVQYRGRSISEYQLIHENLQRSLDLLKINLGRESADDGAFSKTP